MNENELADIKARDEYGFMATPQFWAQAGPQAFKDRRALLGEIARQRAEMAEMKRKVLGSIVARYILPGG